MGAAAGRARQERWRTPVVVGGSVAVHAVVLGWLASQAMGFDPADFCCEPDVFWPTIKVRLEAPGASSPSGLPSDFRARAVRGPDSPATETATTSEAARDHTPVPAPAVATPSRTPPGSATVPVERNAAVQDQWRVRPGGANAQIDTEAAARAWRLGPTGCRTIRDRMTAEERTLCDERFANAALGPPSMQSSAPTARRQVGRSSSPQENGREEGFAATAAANESWRNYTRGDGGYPGLRSLFTQH